MAVPLAMAEVADGGPAPPNRPELGSGECNLCQSDHASIAKISRPCGYISNNTRSPLVCSYPHLPLPISSPLTFVTL